MVKKFMAGNEGDAPYITDRLVFGCGLLCCYWAWVVSLTCTVVPLWCFLGRRVRDTGYWLRDAGCMMLVTGDESAFKSRVCI